MEPRSWLPFDYVFDRFRDRIAGLTDDEYTWEPAPSVPTIAWRMQHVGELLRDDRNREWLGREPVPGDAVAASLSTVVGGVAFVEASYSAWSELLGSLSDNELWEPLGARAGAYGDDPVVSFIVHILDELVHHTAEVALLRDLYAGLGKSA